MPQAVPLPDGRYVAIREGETPQQAYARAQQMYPEAFAQKQAPAPKETTFGGQTKEFFKGLVPGAIGLTEQAGIGISALLPEEQEKATQKYIKETAAAAKAPFAAAPGYEDTVGRKLGEATGSIAPFLATGPFGLAGRAAGYGLGIGAGAGTQVEKSAAEGATEGQQTAATALGAAVGATEMFAPLRILKRIGEPAAEGAVAFIKRALTAGGEEAAQEAAAQAAQNLISKGIYKPEQEIIEQVGESAAYGGAVGGLAQGLLDLAIGRRAPTTATTQQEEYKRLRAEEADRLAKEREYKKTPDYAQDVSTKYLAAEQQRKDLLAQVKKINKDSPTVSADRAFNSDINAQVKELTKSTIDPLKNEYNRVQPILKQLAEKERVAKLTPQEYAFGIEPEQAAPQAQAEPRMYYDQEIAPASAVTTEPDKVAQHAAESIVLANEQRLTAEKFDPKNTTPAVSDYVEYLMRDPALAEQVVQNRAKLPGLPTGLKNAEVLDALKLQTEPLRKAREKAELEPFKTEMAIRTEALKPGKEAPLEDRTINAMKEWQDMMDDPRKEVGDRYFDYLEPLFNKAIEGKPRAIEVNNLVMPSKRATEERARLDKALADKAQADADYITAKRAGEQVAAKAAFERGNTIQEQIDTMAKDSAPHVRATLDARKAQEEALTSIEESLDRVRRGETLGQDKMATGTAKTLAERAEKARGEYITSALIEAAITRRAQAKPAITTDEAVKAASELHDALTEWVTRAQAAPRRESLTEVVTQPAQMRGTQVVRGAETEMRDLRPLEQRRFGAYDKAVQVIKEQLEQIRENLGNPTITPTRVEGLKMQFASTEAKKVAEAKGETATTVAGELRRRTEFVRNLMAKKPLSPLVKDTRDALNRAADVMDSGKASRTLLDAVEYVATNLAEGRRVLPQDVRAINEALQVGQQVAASVEGAPKQGQLDLSFEAPGEKKRAITADLGLIRASARNFINSPPVREARAALDRAKELQALEKKQNAKKAKAAAARREQRITELEGMISDARGDYQTEVYRAFTEAKQAATEARNAVLDPQIKATSDALNKASKRLDTVNTEIGKNIKRFEAVLTQEEGKDRTKLATYELLKLEERRSIAEDTKKEIEDAQAELAKLIEQRTENFDGKEFAAQAVLDGNVRIERNHLARLEERMAKLQDNPNPAQVAERAAMQQELAAQREAVRKAEEFTRKERDQSQKEVEALMRQREGLGLSGLRRTEGRLTPILSKEEQAIADRRDEAFRALRESEERAERMEVRKARIGVAEKELVEAQEAGDKKRITLLTKEIEALKEGRKRKQRAATRDVTTGPKELRTGSPERLEMRAAQRRTLEQASEALRAEREGGIYGEYEAPDLRGLFRTAKNVGNGMKAEEVTRLTDRIVQDWKITPEIKVVDDESGLPQAIQDQAKRDEKTGQIPGLYDPNTKTVYLVASNLGSGHDVAMTLAHEVAGHFGLREVLGGTYASTMNRLYEGNRAVREQADAKLQAEPNLDKNTAVEEVLAEMAETGATPANEGALRQIYNAIKQWLAKTFRIANVTDNEVKQIVANARKYVIEGAEAAAGDVDTSGILYRTKAVYANPQLEEASKNVDKIVAREKSVWEKVKANGTGLAFETQVVDRFAGFERLAKYMEPLKGSQMMYYLRMYDQRMNFTSQSLANGAPTVREITRPDGQIERIIESAEGPNIGNVVNILKDAPAGNGEAVNRLFTLYMAAARAKNKGLASLNFSEEVTQEMLDDTVAAIEATPGLADKFKEAKDEYNAYNRSLIDFLTSTGAINKKVADRLVQENDYIPFYRERGGVAELVIGSETPIRIGSIAEQPYLHELVGGDKPILDFLTSSVQNTNMLVDMGMRNLATKNAIYELVDLGAAKFVKTAAGPDVVKFREDGDERYAVVASEKVKIGNKEFETGVPADLLVKGMEGIPTQMPVLLRAMAMPSMLLRKAITLSPVYMAKQLFRDSLAAPIVSGANFTPVMGALREIGSAAKEKLERRGIVGGQQFTGTMDDRSKILRDMIGNKTGWMQALGKMEALGMEADALTRRAQYNSYIEQGLSEMEATMMALESMNFNKRGASPSIHAANALIPFFNAQIQGLNVLYKALSGKMPFNDQLKIREKLLQRGSMMMVASLVYAAAMQDDEAYKNATPDQKYANWFVRVPGLDEPIRVPIPFEIGYIFKALPEALYNSMVNEHGGEEAVKAFKQILLQTIPGGSSYGIPQALKPAIEAGLGKSFYTGRDILSRREQQLLPEEQFRSNTSEAAKMVGEMFGISPVVFEQLVSGYTGTMGLALLHAVSVGVPKSEAPDQAVKRLSDTPVVGSVFQPNDAGGVINSVYDRMLEDIKVKETVDKMMEEGRMNDAQALLQRRGNEYMEAELATQFKSDMNKLTQAERAINASAMSPEEKRAQLTEVRKLKILVANTTREIADKTIRLSSPF
jgi:hypothetical protein